jgi:hypothetical protein
MNRIVFPIQGVKVTTTESIKTLSEPYKERTRVQFIPHLNVSNDVKTIFIRLSPPPPNMSLQIYKHNNTDVRIEVLTAVLTKVVIFCDIALCSPYLTERWFLARLIIYPDDGGDMFLRNVGSYTDYKALYSRRWQFSLLKTFMVEFR